MWRWGGVVLGVCLYVSVGLSGCSRSYTYYDYVVRPGDTLSEIGHAYRVSYHELARLNKLRNPDRIRVGQRLRLPQHAVYRGSNRRTAPRPRRRPPTQRPIPADSQRLFSWPLRGQLTSEFGPRNGSFHDGIDIAAPLGTPVQAAATGRVVFSGTLRGYGKVVILKHENGFNTVYAHHSRNLVKTGASVQRGETIGTVGQTGRVSGPSLHFEVRSGRKARDPLHYLPKSRHAFQRK